MRVKRSIMTKINEVIHSWRKKVNGDIRYKQEFLNQFVGNLLEYILQLNEYDRDIMYDFIRIKQNFVKDKKYVICKYLENILKSKNESEMKLKFKLYIDLGLDTRSEITKSLKSRIEKIRKLQQDEYQLIEQNKTIKEYQEILIKKDKELSLLERKLEQEKIKNEKVKKRNVVLEEENRKYLEKVYVLQTKIIENYEKVY